MGKHTTDEIYDKLSDLEFSVKPSRSNGNSSPVTDRELSQQITGLKKAIADGPQDKKTDFKGALQELPVLKEILAVLKAGGGPAYIVLGIVAIKAGLSAIGIKLFDIQKATQALSRKLSNGKEVTTNENGRITRAVPEQPQGMRLPSLEQVNDVTEAIKNLNGEIHTYSSRARELPSSRELKRLADSAGRLTAAAGKHADVGHLASATHTLTERFQELSRAVGGTSGT